VTDEDEKKSDDGLFGCLWLWVFFCFMFTAITYSFQKNLNLSALWVVVAAVWLLAVRFVEKRNKK
jgi:uncharacterized membrane-anchored protein